MTSSAGPTEDPFPDGIIDAHHHLYARPGLRYLVEDYIADIRRTGLDLRASVYVQARSNYLPDGPEHIRVLGETSFALAEGDRAEEAGFLGVCAGIVGAADLTAGAAVRDILERHIALAGHVAYGGRFCGIRHILAWDEDASLLNPAYPTSADMMDRSDFRAGLAVLSDMDLSFDAWLLSPQLPRLIRLARDFPDLRIVLNHCGGAVAVGPYADRTAEIFSRWSADIAELARCANVTVKLGGLGMALSGFRLTETDLTEGPAALARLWQPWVYRLIEEFGAERLMLESNAPADRTLYPFDWGWRAFAGLLVNLPVADRQALCRGTAERIYRLQCPVPGHV